MVTKHHQPNSIPIRPNSIPIQPNSIPNQPNSIPIQPNSIPIQPNSIPIQPNSIPIYLHENQCDKCEKILSSKQNYNKHIKKCKGKINPLECQICKEVFTLPQNKYRHLKICKDRIPSTDLTISEEIGKTIIGTNIGNIQTQNNTQNNIQTQNNTQNVTLVIYNTDPNKSDNFIKNHISHAELKNILKITHGDINDEKKVSMVEEYMRNLMKNPDNHCIKKTNMRDIHSKIHTGNNNWITKTDTEIYPKLTCNIADGLSELIQVQNNEKTMVKSKKLKELLAFLDYMTDRGYRNDEDEEINAQTKAFYKDLVKRIKSVIYDFTKDNL